MLPQNQTLMIKVGTASLSCADGSLNETFLTPFVQQIAQLKRQNNRVILVSSGAVGAGRERMRQFGWSPDANFLLEEKAIAFTIGQPALVTRYAELFEREGFLAGQILLRNDYFSNGHTSARNNFLANLERSFALPFFVPILNENDFTSNDENTPLCKDDPDTFPDNDGLNSLVGRLVKADMCITVSTHAVYTMNPCQPEARLVPYINFASDTQSLAALGISTEGLSCGGRGGMGNKIDWLRQFVQAGACGTRRASIIDAQDVIERGGLVRAALGEPVGTRLVCTRPDAVRGVACSAAGYICAA